MKNKVEQTPNRWVVLVVNSIARLAITIFCIMVGYLLAFLASMGLTIAPEVWDGGLDMLIRLGAIAIGFTICIAALMRLVWPLIRYSWRMLRALKRT